MRTCQHFSSGLRLQKIPTYRVSISITKSSQSLQANFPLGETEPEYVMWSPEDIQPTGQEQQQSKPEMCVRVGVKPSALCFLLYRSTPLGQHYLL